MTPEQIELVQITWAKVAPNADQVAALFYDRLFEIAPEVKPLFTGDMLEQGKKLMAMLNMAVTSLDHLEQMLPAVHEMGVRHTSYGVQPEHYDAVAEALLWTLEKGLRETFGPDAREAWAAVYSALAAEMKEAAAAAV